MKPRVRRDLNQHFHDQLGQFLEDSMDTCHHAGISDQDAAIMLLAMLMNEAAFAAVAMKASEEDFIGASRIAYQKADLYGGHKKKTRKVVVT